MRCEIVCACVLACAFVCVRVSLFVFLLFYFFLLSLFIRLLYKLSVENAAVYSFLYIIQKVSTHTRHFKNTFGFKSKIYIFSVSDVYTFYACRLIALSLSLSRSYSNDTFAHTRRGKHTHTQSHLCTVCTHSRFIRIHALNKKDHRIFKTA